MRAQRAMVWTGGTTTLRLKKHDCGCVFRLKRLNLRALSISNFGNGCRKRLQNMYKVQVGSLLPACAKERRSTVQ